MTTKRLNLITAGIALSVFLASMEGTVVATAMPSIVGQLGGLSIYSWVFSVYLLTSTTTVPLYGKFSDLYGRKPVYVISMAFFLAGSVLCGLARSMEQLIFFRAVQGLGAGGVLPLAFTIVGELFSLEKRAKLQGWISGIWGVSSVIGPLIGGFFVDYVSWQWVFYINVFPGAAAIALIWFAWKDPEYQTGEKVPVDYAGALLLTLGALCLLLGLGQLGTSQGTWFLLAAAVLCAALVWAERHAADPILPPFFFQERLFVISILHAFLSGWAMFGTLNYVPLFVQGVLGTTATAAGIALTPMSLCWTLASIYGSHQLLKTGYRTLALIGMASLAVGSFLTTRIGLHTSQLEIMVYTGLMGIGMGLSVPAFMIAVQSAVRRETLGAVTSTLQYSRSIGGTVGVSVLGAFLGSGLTSRLLSAGIDPASANINTLLDASSGMSASLGIPLREALAGSISSMFLLAFIPALAALLAVFFAPAGTVSELAKQNVQEHPEIDLP